ncbi:hypothetical protein GRF29_213g1028883 [Pseudopithomyces chartarum]|uniref:Microtubule associated protein n=1 Tax=Pseudopithomyces chartarum TaxID=1892770 RepID=A0AAN6LNF2_9PLEO|nr:hypothetical protein GRF29_213g1028883 [Pseudopithomyces chartarum]
MGSPPSNPFAAAVRRLYRPLGFTKGYNVILFFIFAGAMLTVCIARLKFFDFHGTMCGEGVGATLPGECYWYKKSLFAEIGIRIHLYGVLPAGILAVFQFIPAIRRKSITFHRVAGYISNVLVLIGTIGGFMIAGHSVGGGADIQVAVWFLGIVVIIQLGLAMWNIKKLQIDQHRAWMLRAWFLLGTPITTRIILVFAAAIVTKQNNYLQTRHCEHIEFMLQSATKTLEFYPECAAYFNGSNPDQHAIVRASMDFNRVDQMSAALGTTFGMALWLGMALQAAGIEIYLQLTPKESDRLRQISYRKQMEAGYVSPGNAGLTAQSIGDANPFVPPAQRRAGLDTEKTPLLM